MSQHIILAAAAAAHEANRAYCAALGDRSQAPWADAPEWQRESAIQGVLGVLKGNGPEESHAGWLRHKASEGWIYGATKDPEKKTHPCMVPYADLPPEQRKKDDIFVSTVLAVFDGFQINRASSTREQLKDADAVLQNLERSMETWEQAGATPSPTFSVPTPNARYLRLSFDLVRHFTATELALNEFVTAPGRSKALAITALQEAFGWANRALIEDPRNHCTCGATDPKVS